MWLAQSSQVWHVGGCWENIPAGSGTPADGSRCELTANGGNFFDSDFILGAAGLKKNLDGKNIE